MPVLYLPVRMFYRRGVVVDKQERRKKGKSPQLNTIKHYSLGERSGYREKRRDD